MKRVRNGLPGFLAPIIALFLLYGHVYLNTVVLNDKSIKTMEPGLIHHEPFPDLDDSRDKKEQNSNWPEKDLCQSNANNHYNDVMVSGTSLIAPDSCMAEACRIPVRLEHPYSTDPGDAINAGEPKGAEMILSPGAEKDNDKGKSVSVKKALNKDRVKIRKHLMMIAIELDLDPRLALSMAKVESGYNPESVSPKGAVGVLQVMPKYAWHDFRITREMLFDPKVNIRVGLSRMKSLLDRFNHDLDLSLAAYNAGASRVVKAGYNIPPIEETQSYVKKVRETMDDEV
ncbi:MAG: lytic transglycosylase domain-containing protein [Deltaproteobacteria bacterium]|nr:lytic transglycosylase domain-containing protein [Deltaproteobacteria bacterium]